MTDHSQGTEKIIVKIDPDLEELIPGFMKNRYRDIDGIQEALHNEDYETIRVIGHTMKGAGGGYGFDEISEIGLHIEKAAVQKEPENIQKQVAHLQDYLGKVKIVWEE